MDENWIRWIKASINKHFDDRKGNLFLFLEGKERDTHNQPSWVELKVDGPVFTQHSKNNWEIEVGIDSLVFCIIDDLDLYRLERVIGKLLTIYTSTISIFKFGEDATEIGCFVVEPNGIQVSNLGQLNAQVSLQQSIIESRYKMWLTP